LEAFRHFMMQEIIRERHIISLLLNVFSLPGELYNRINNVLTAHAKWTDKEALVMNMLTQQKESRRFTWLSFSPLVY